jgi:hypothetical protein
VALMMAPSLAPMSGPPQPFVPSLKRPNSMGPGWAARVLASGSDGGAARMQAPYSELQVRRDSVIYALRNLVGATQEAYGPNDWPRGLDAYRSLFNRLLKNSIYDAR